MSGRSKGGRGARSKRCKPRSELLKLDLMSSLDETFTDTGLTQEKHDALQELYNGLLVKQAEIELELFTMQQRTKKAEMMAHASNSKLNVLETLVEKELKPHISKMVEDAHRLESAHRREIAAHNETKIRLETAHRKEIEEHNETKTQLATAHARLAELELEQARARASAPPAPPEVIDKDNDLNELRAKLYTQLRVSETQGQAIKALLAIEKAARANPGLMVKAEFVSVAKAVRDQFRFIWPAMSYANAVRAMN